MKESILTTEKLIPYSQEDNDVIYPLAKSQKILSFKLKIEFPLPKFHNLYIKNIKPSWFDIGKKCTAFIF